MVEDSARDRGGLASVLSYTSGWPHIRLRSVCGLKKRSMGESHAARISRPSNQATSFMSLRLYKTAHLELGARCSDRHGRTSTTAATSPGFIGDENSGDPARRDRRHSSRTGSPGISISNAASLQASAISRNPFRCSSVLARAAQRIHSRAY